MPPPGKTTYLCPLTSEPYKCFACHAPALQCCDPLAGSNKAALQDKYTYRTFKMGRCAPDQAAGTVGSADQLAAGRVEVIITEVVDTGRRQVNLDIQASAHSSTADKKLAEGKKVRGAMHRGPGRALHSHVHEQRVWARQMQHCAQQIA
jgi:hypothetical protein